jgi:outer membrane receptor protein involved in Fe transport
VPSGTQLPTVPKFKGSATARYTFPMGASMDGHVQAAYAYQSETSSSLSPYQNNLLGSVAAYGTLDLLAGLNRGNFSAELFAQNALDKRADTYRFAECTIVGGLQTFIPGVTVCGTKPMAVITQPRTIGIRFSQSF